MAGPTTGDIYSQTQTAQGSPNLSLSVTTSPGATQMRVWYALKGTNLSGGAQGFTYGGVPLTLDKGKVQTEATTICAGEWWYLDNPTPGTATLVCTPNVVPPTSSLMISRSVFGGATGAAEASVAYGSSVDSLDYPVGGAGQGADITTLSANALLLSGFANNTNVAITAPNETLDGAYVIDTGGTVCGGAVSKKTIATPSLYTVNWHTAASSLRAVAVQLSIAPAAVVPLALNDIAAARVFQRVNGKANIPLTGTYDSGYVPNKLEAKVTKQDGSIIVDWTPLTSPVIAGNNWSGTLPNVPEGGGQAAAVGYKVQVRGLDSGGAPISSAVGSNYWGVGDNELWVGSSSAAFAFSFATTTVADNRLSMYTGAGWAVCTGAGAIPYGNLRIAQNPGIPLGLINCAVAGSRLTGWVAKDSNYTTMLSRVAAIGGIVTRVICAAGANGYDVGEITSLAGRISDYRAFIANTRSDLNLPNLPWGVWGVQRAITLSPTYDQEFTWARAAEETVALDTNCFLATTTMDLPIDTDNTHLTQGATGGEAVAASRAAYARRGPVLIGGRYNPATGLFFLQFDKGGGDSLVGGSSQSGIQGVKVYLNGVAQSFIVAPYVSGPSYLSGQLATGLSGTFTAGINTGASPGATTQAAPTNMLYNNGVPY